MERGPAVCMSQQSVSCLHRVSLLFLHFYAHGLVRSQCAVACVLSLAVGEGKRVVLSLAVGEGKRAGGANQS